MVRKSKGSAAKQYKRSLVTAKKYYGILVVGRRGWGKTTFLEWLAEQYKVQEDFLVVDPWSARDHENLYWCVPGPGGGRHKMILVHPDYVKVKVPKDMKPWVKPMNESMGWSKILETGIKEKSVVCLNNTDYREDDAYLACAKLVRELPIINRNVLHKDLFFCLREAGALVFSHLKVSKSASETRAAILQLIRESRHNRITWVMDTQRYGDVYKGMRDNTDVIIFKKTSRRALPRELQGVWDYINLMFKKTRSKNWPSLNFLRIEQFYADWADGRFNLGSSGLPSFHHKTEKDLFSQITGITFEAEDFDALDGKYGRDEDLGKIPKRYRYYIASITGQLLRKGEDPFHIAAMMSQENVDFLRYLKLHERDFFIGADGRPIKLPASQKIPKEILAQYGSVPLVKAKKPQRM